MIDVQSDLIVISLFSRVNLHVFFILCFFSFLVMIENIVMVVTIISPYNRGESITVLCAFREFCVWHLFKGRHSEISPLVQREVSAEPG